MRLTSAVCIVSTLLYKIVLTRPFFTPTAPLNRPVVTMHVVSLFSDLLVVYNLKGVIRDVGSIVSTYHTYSCSACRCLDEYLNT